MKYYFAYGSNMDEERMKRRGITFFNKIAGKLSGYKLVFQEFLKDENKNSYANIIPDENSLVEGIVYEVDDTITDLDKYEKVPRYYHKEKKIISTKKGNILCVVYIGNLKNIGIEKPPKKEYMKHLLKGKNYLSKKYYDKLKKVKIIN